MDSAHPVDVHVGGMVRILRKRAGLSQSALAEALGLTFQQVQKYERGVNRISASKLYEVAEFVGAPMSAFFEGYPPEHGPDATTPDAVVDFMSTPEGAELAALFQRIRPPLRAKALDLIRTLADLSARD